MTRAGTKRRKGRALEPRPEAYLVDVDLLAAAPDNPRTITREAFGRLVRSLQTDPGMLAARPIIATPDAQAVAGNMRLRACQQLKADGDEGFLARWPGGLVPTFVADLDEQTRAAWMLRDNNPYGEWEDQALAELMQRYLDEGGDVILTGFPEGDVQMILEGVGAAGGGPRVIPEDLETEYRCPGCGYEWNGSPKPPRADDPEGGAAGARQLAAFVRDELGLWDDFVKWADGGDKGGR